MIELSTRRARRMQLFRETFRRPGDRPVHAAFLAHMAYRGIGEAQGIEVLVTGQFHQALRKPSPQQRQVRRSEMRIIRDEAPCPMEGRSEDIDGFRLKCTLYGHESCASIRSRLDPGAGDAMIERDNNRSVLHRGSIRDDADGLRSFGQVMAQSRKNLN